MLLLKTLKAAEEAGDHVYAVIRGSAENHGGRANSLTAPNPKAQAELLRAAYAQAGIDPRTVGYIEAHGTGTPLGDPVEVNGLKAAFRDLYRATGDAGAASPRCGLGSVKTNIGHLEYAAGIAGVIKVLLQMRHETLVESLHCKSVNPYIDLAGSPFYIVQRTQRWEPLRDATGAALPRRAGVSSFGFGGVNAHVVLEEYRPRTSARVEVLSHVPALVVLSAKTEDRLREQARLLAAALRDRAGRYDLAEVIYTLQVGREPLEERLAMRVASIAELAERLERFARAGDTAQTIRGRVRSQKALLAELCSEAHMARVIDECFAERRYDELLARWVSGVTVDWARLYGDAEPRRVSLPTYPFAREHYWVPEAPMHTSSENGASKAGLPRALHPLLHVNTSDASIRG
jgi:acyl transferase domain-containing protein